MVQIGSDKARGWC